MTNTDTADKPPESAIEPINIASTGDETLQMDPQEIQKMLNATAGTTRYGVVITVQPTSRLAQLQGAKGQLPMLLEIILSIALKNPDDLLSLCQEIAELDLSPQTRAQCLRIALSRPEASQIPLALGAVFLCVPSVDQQIILQKLDSKKPASLQEILEMMSAIQNPNHTNLLFRKLHYKIAIGENQSKEGNVLPKQAISAMKERRGIQPHAMALQIKVPENPQERLHWLFPLASALGSTEATLKILERFDSKLAYVPPKPEPKRTDSRM